MIICVISLIHQFRLVHSSQHQFFEMLLTACNLSNVHKKNFAIAIKVQMKNLLHVYSSEIIWSSFLLLTLLLHVLGWAGHNTDLPSDINISKTVRVNIAFARTFFKENSRSFLIVCKSIDFAFVVLKLLMFQVCVIIGISKIEFFNFSDTDRVNFEQVS